MERKKDKEIGRLLDRFFDGETTLDEERQLYGYFSSGEVSPELMPLRQMFLDLQAVEASPSHLRVGGEDYQVRKKGPAVRRAVGDPLWKRFSRVAAMLAMVGILAAVYFSNANRSECEMLVYGKRVTRQEAVMGEVRHTMEAACEAAPDVKGQLLDVFGDGRN